MREAPAAPVDDLIANPAAFDHTPAADAQFLAAMQAAFRWHYAQCPPYEARCRLEGVAPDDIRGHGDLIRIPFLFVTVLKRRRFLSVPESEVELTLESSGTGGEKSAINLDAVSLERIRKIVWNIYAAFGMADRSVTSNALCFTYDPAVAHNIGTAFSDELLSTLTGLHRRFFAIRWNAGADRFDLDREGVLAFLDQCADDPHPLRVLGFPSFAWEMRQIARRLGKPSYRFPENSYMITGGGWKTLADQEIPKPLFRREMGEWLGIPPDHVRDLLGMVEHGVPYCECEAGRMHVPIYSKVWARDPATLEVLPDGAPGLLHLMTPYLRSVPYISVLTSDVGTLHRKCPCGRNAPWLEFLGRAGTAAHTGCAITALEILKR